MKAIEKVLENSILGMFSTKKNSKSKSKKSRTSQFGLIQDKPNEAKKTLVALKYLEILLVFFFFFCLFVCLF